MSSSNELDVGIFCLNQYKPHILLAHHPDQTRNIRNLLVGIYSKHRQYRSVVVPSHGDVVPLYMGGTNPTDAWVVLKTDPGGLTASPSMEILWA